MMAYGRESKSIGFRFRLQKFWGVGCSSKGLS